MLTYADQSFTFTLTYADQDPQYTHGPGLTYTDQDYTPRLPIELSFSYNTDGAIYKPTAHIRLITYSWHLLHRPTLPLSALTALLAKVRL